MAVKPWREVALPHRDIREGRFDESTFAADLADVLADRGPLEYRDPEMFFRKTYPTEGMVRLLSVVLSRLSGKGRGEPVIQIQTPFGGGKTHSLVALYHLLKSGEDHKDEDLVKKVLKEAGVKAIPTAKVAVFVGTAADPLKGKTPWGAIAEQLGHYELLKEHDARRRTPGKELLHTLLGDEPVLILMDEVAQYVAKCVDPEEIERTGASQAAARAYQTQVLAFMQELTETVKVLPQGALVVTLPSSAPYGEEGERSLQELQKLFGRLEAVYEPVRGEEIYEVIRKRLFEDVGDPTHARRVAQSYWDLYRRLEGEVPDAVREDSYRDKMRRAYPFHPEVIDLLFERWSTLSTFQRTRGVLRLLAEVVSDLYQREHAAPLIQPAHVNLANPDIRRELVKHIGPEFDGVIASDIADTNAKAQKIDRQMGSEYARFAVASGLATSIFLYSFSGGERKGAGIPQLRVAMLREGIPSPLVGDALHHLEEELWYLHVDSGVYRFTNQPNLNRIILEREEAVADEHIRQEIRDRLEQLAGREMKVHLYPRPSDLPDTKELKLAVLEVEQATETFIRELVEKSGSTFRVYKNTLVILAPDADELLELCRLVKRYLALRSIRDDKSVVRQLSAENREALEARLKDADGKISFELLSAYRRLMKASDRGVEHFDLGLPTAGVRSTLAKRAHEYLKGQELLLDRISPRQVVHKALREGETERAFAEIYDAFLRYPHLPMVADRHVLEQAIAQGVQDGEFALRVGERIYFRESVPASALPDAILIRKETVIPHPGEVSAARPEERATVVGAGREGTQGSSEAATPRGRSAREAIRSLDMRVQLPWNRLSDFLRGVLMPLQQEGAKLEIEVHLQARSESDIKKSTLDHQVKETLKQIGATIKEFKEE
jgi:predicted AAA+ superfamily ATPase